MACPLPQWQWCAPCHNAAFQSLGTSPYSSSVLCGCTLASTLSRQRWCCCPSFLFRVLGLKPRASCIPEEFSITELNHHHPFSWEGLGVETGVNSAARVVLGLKIVFPPASRVLRQACSCSEASTLLFGERDGLSVTQAGFQLLPQWSPFAS